MHGHIFRGLCGVKTLQSYFGFAQKGDFDFIAQALTSKKMSGATVNAFVMFFASGKKPK